LKGGDGTDYESKLFFYHGDHLSSTQMITDINANISQAVLYTPWGSVIKEYKADWMLDTIPRYLFNAKEKDEESGMYYYEARYYAPPTFISRDPLFEKCPFMSPYAYCSNSPINRIDPTGMMDEDPSVHIDNKGNVIAQYDDDDNSVYVHATGTTEAQIDQQRAQQNNTGGNGKKIGELGGTIDASTIMKNKLQESAGIAMLMGLPAFEGFVHNGGVWDLKSNTETIWGVAWAFDGDNTNKTMFNYDGYSMNAADVGNFHYGVTGKFLYFGVGMPDIVLEAAGGWAEIQKNEREGNSSAAQKGREQFNSLTRPYGDRVRDNYWIRMGMNKSSSIK
jgi:RHS repeat-associated protein